MYTTLDGRYTVRMRNVAAANSSHQWGVSPSIFSTGTSGFSRVSETIPTQLQRWINLSDIQSSQLNIVMTVGFIVLFAFLSIAAKRDIEFSKGFWQWICAIVSRLCLRADR